MKSLRFLGNSLKALREFPEDARQDAGYQIDKVQRGEQPDDFKPMPGLCVALARASRTSASGTSREPTGLPIESFFTAQLADAVIVLHAFQKKTQTTSKRDVDLAKERFTEFMKGQK